MMLNVLIYGCKDIQLVNEDGCCVATYESIETAKRAKALWNMAERLGLSTEDIEGITDSASLHNFSLEVMAKEMGDSK